MEQMQHVLILTKNVLSEEQLVKQLHYLSYEVMSSSDLIQAVQAGKNLSIFSYFQVVMISETLSNSELEQLLPNLKLHPVSVLRIGDELSMDDSIDWRKAGVYDWLAKDASVETLREIMIQAVQAAVERRLLTNQIVAFPTNEQEKTVGLFKSIHNSFSKTEKKVFERLLLASAKNQIVSRKEMCDYLWKDGETPSNMSQLSCLIHKIKNKFEMAGVTNEVIVTLWGRGYKLNENFYEQFLNEENEQELLTESAIN